MRLSLAMVALVVAGLGVSAQPADEPATRIEHHDRADDTALMVGGDRGIPHGDIDWFAVSHQTDLVEFEVVFHAWPGAVSAQWSVDIGFAYGGAHHRIFLEPRPAECDGAVLLRKAGLEWRRAACPETIIDEQGARLSVMVMPEAIHDRFGVPAPGGELQDVWVLAVVNQMGAYRELAWQDRAPDEDSIGPLVLSDEQDMSKVKVTAQRDVLPTNGEQSIFSFHVSLTNRGSEPVRAVLEVQGHPSDWELKVPPRVDIGAQTVKNVTIVVVVPLQHAHGSAEHFDLVVSDAGTLQEVGRKQLGLQWLAIPQPTQHHPNLYLHAIGQAEAQRRWFNAASSDPDAEAVDFEFESGDFPPTRTWRTGDFWMVPEIFQGLHFVPNGTAHLQFDLWLPESLQDATARLDLIHCEYASGIVSGTACDREDGVQGLQTRILASTVELGDLSQGSNSLDVAYPILEGITVVPSSPDAAMYMNIRVTGVAPTLSPISTEVARVTQGSYALSLPLLEYVEALEGAAAAGGWQLTADDLSSRRANPGDLVVFGMTVENHSNDTRRFEATTLGTLGKDARLFIDSSELSPGAKSKVQVAAVVPEAVPGQVLDGMLLVGEASSFEAAALRFSVLVVDPGVEDIPSDAMPGERGGKNAPAGAALLALALGALKGRNAKK